MAATSSPFSWNGSILSAPIADLKRCSWLDLPAGPAWAAPFNGSSWRLWLFNSLLDGIHLHHNIGRPTFQGSSVCQVRLLSEFGVEDSDPIKITFTATEFTEEGGREACLKIRAHLSAKAATKKVLQLAVLHSNAPTSLHSARHDSELTAHYLTGLVQSPLPFDVRFSFPRSGQDLWASSAILKQVSPYFKTQLESDFAEAVPTKITYTGETTELDSGLELEFSDSDYEGPAHNSRTPPKPQSKVHTIKVTSHSFNTYHAVWIWITTKQINFAPLVPALTDGNSAPSQPAPKRRKLDATATANAATAAPPAAPPAVSPKSVYRLAHLLELESLRLKALDAFKSSLNVANATDQLFSSTSASYDEVRAAAAEFVAERWDAVEETAEMKAKMAQVDAGELGHMAPVVLALAKASLAKAKKA